MSIYDSNRNKIERDIYHVTWDIEAAEKSGYAHFMLKEIHEQPKIVRETILKRLPETEDGIVLDNIKLSKQELENIDRIYVVACGTADVYKRQDECLVNAGKPCTDYKNDYCRRIFGVGTGYTYGLYIF